MLILKGGLILFRPYVLLLIYGFTSWLLYVFFYLCSKKTNMSLYLRGIKSRFKNICFRTYLKVLRKICVIGPIVIIIDYNITIMMIIGP